MLTKIEREIRLIKESIAHEKSSKITKLIFEPKITKISTIMAKSKKLNGMCLEQNLENRMSQDMSPRVQNSTCKPN